MTVQNRLNRHVTHNHILCYIDLDIYYDILGCSGSKFMRVCVGVRMHNDRLHDSLSVLEKTNWTRTDSCRFPLNETPPHLCGAQCLLKAGASGRSS